ncbi:MAG: DUF1987 domain-containing protein [Crocinitomicaceae bacterium]|nr:DUF1987 domain-containing protein [Crocinitomicaceae bacterium]MBK6952420.1 DUF1987 domain-containing protein [Crocinitomicaceae bacterium]
MESFKLARTTVTPLIDFQPDGKFLMQGVSVPENSLNFYSGVFEWLEEFKKLNPEKICFELFMEYLNTSSTRSLVDIVVKLKSMKSAELLICWQYESGDDDMLEFGKELELLTGVKIEYKETQYPNTGII